MDNRTLKELTASGLDNVAPLCIQYPTVAQGKTEKFELKSSLLHHIPKYHGLSMENPNKHLKEFEVVCSSMTPVNVDGSILKMKAFPFSLLDKAKDWLYELAPGTVTSWESMKRAFLEKFFPTSRIILLRKKISGIQQEEGGSLVDKTPMAAKILIANQALNAQQYEGVGQRGPPRQQVHEGQENQTKVMQSQDKRVDQLEKQIGQIADFVSKFQDPGQLPSSTIPNPKGGFESAKAILLRSGKEVGAGPKPSTSGLKEDKKQQFEEEDTSPPTAKVDTPLPQASIGPNLSNSANKGKNVSNSLHTNVFPSNVPFPSRFMQTKKEEAERDILETFRKVQVNIPLLDAIKQVPRYAKFLKELCTTRKRMSSKKVVKVGENVSGILQRKLPPKCKDPGSFTIPCVIGNTRFESAMLDLGASINVMPYSIYASMNLGVLKNDGVIIQLADRSNAYPKGVLEDVLVQGYLEDLNDDVLEKVIKRGMELKTMDGDPMHTHGTHESFHAVASSEEFIELVAALESLPKHVGKSPNFDSIPISTNKLLPSIIQAPVLELKPLPSHLKYIFLGENKTLPAIISSSLTA
ncbi:unnamed protein product [Malus baccata var. baccata]